MKHLKKLSVVLLTALLSVNFTSCIETDPSPIVEAIYAAQADLIAAQATVQTAEANYLAAQAAAEQANADLLTAQAANWDALTAGIVEGNAYAAAQNEQALLLLVAQTNRDVAAAQNALALANQQFEVDMAELVAELEAAGVQLAADYAYSYRYAMMAANDILEDRLDAEADLATAMLMVNADEDVTWAYFLTQLEGDIAGYTATKAGLEAAIASMEAYMADPSTAEAQLSALQASYDDFEAMIDAKEIALQVKENEIMAIYDAHNSTNDIVDRYEDAEGDLNDMLSDKEDVEDDIADAQDDIADWTTDLADYAAALALLEADVTAAQAAFDAAETAQEDAEDASDLADAAAAAALIVRDDLVTALSLLNAAYQTAIANYATEQGIFDAGLPAATLAVTTAQANVDAAVAAELIAQADYDAKKAAFELLPGGPTGFVWTAGVDGALGIHADATTVTNSYYVVNATDNGVDALTLVAGAGVDYTGTYGTYAAFLADATAGTLAPTDFYNVGADDIAGGTNADRLDAALVALTIAENAIAPLVVIRDAAQDSLDNFGDDLADAIVEYNIQKDFYDNGVADLAAAELALTAADAAAVTAQDTEDDADADLVDAQDDLDDAEAAVTAFEACDEDCIQDNIDDANANIADWNEILAAMQPVIDAKQAVVDSLQAEYDAAVEGYFSSLSPEDHAAIIALWQEAWVMEEEIDTLEDQQDLVWDLIDLYDDLDIDDLDDLAGYLADYKDDLQDACDDLEMAQVALAEAQVEEAAEVAYIEYLQALVDTLNLRYANAMAIADAYKALMDAALAG